jgi:hypothetical protein
MYDGYQRESFAPMSLGINMGFFRVLRYQCGAMAKTMTKLNHHSDSQEAQEHSEGTIARTMEGQTAKLPADAWL